MGKVRSALLIAALLVGAVAGPFHGPAVRAQTALPPVSCAAGIATTPMPGHYTGPWHSEADYHFLAFGHDILIAVTIDGTIGVTVSPDGRMVGTVQGSVDAPETHDGQKDVSSGHGTITGQVQGAFATGGSLALLSQPVIFMHWGTFVGGGYTADRYITMPDYQFPVGRSSCVGATGTIVEQGFPTQNIVNDFNGGIVQVPGVGTATGTWQLTSDSAAKFGQLSQQVDGLLTQASALLSDPATVLTPALVEQQIAQPLRQLEATLRQDPSVARCLLDRIGAWEAATLPHLLDRMPPAPTDLLSFRRAADLVRSVRLLDLDCNLVPPASGDAVLTAGNALLDRALAARTGSSGGSWSDVVLTIRDLYLFGGTAIHPAIQQRVNAALHAAMAASSGAHLLELARIAYLTGDDEDAVAAFHRLPATVRLTETFEQNAKQTRKKKRHAKHPKPKPTATPTPSPTPTPPPKTLLQVLTTGLHPIVTSSTTASPVTFDWQPLTGATHYVVTVTTDQMPRLLWSWSGTTTSVKYGDTALPDVPGSEQDGWSEQLPVAGYTWSVIALDQHDRIIGSAFRVPN